METLWSTGALVRRLARAPPPSMFTTLQCPPPGIFTTHHCHLLQVPLQHITATFSCPSGWKKHHLLVEGLLSMGLPRLVFSSCLSLHVPGSAPRPGHWTLDTRQPSPRTQTNEDYLPQLPGCRQLPTGLETNITGGYLGLHIRLVLSYFVLSKKLALKTYSPNLFW